VLVTLAMLSSRSSGIRGWSEAVSLWQGPVVSPASGLQDTG
jgi:hypothetical protein